MRASIRYGLPLLVAGAAIPLFHLLRGYPWALASLCGFALAIFSFLILDYGNRIRRVFRRRSRR